MWAYSPWVSKKLPILLSGYAAKQCARRVHNEWDPTIDTVAAEPTPELQMLFDAGRAFEVEAFGRIRHVLGPGRFKDLSDVHGRKSLIDATLAAMDAGAEMILGGWLPDDPRGGRVGKPDILLRHGKPGDTTYVPGDVKGHKTTVARATKTLQYSRVARPGDVEEGAGYAAQITNRLDDFLQLAHYWRMLEACGRAPKDVDATGFILGTDRLVDLDPLGSVLVWHDLTARQFETYSRSQGKVKRSALERYDHELAFRLKVAQVAASRTGTVDDPAPLVEPIFKEECDSCPWYEYCRSIADADAASAHIRSGRLSVREWHALAGLGIHTVSDLASLDANGAKFQASYLPEVTDQKDPIRRLSDAVRRARMIEAGTVLERETTGPIDVPRADVEIDLDIEWDRDGRVYLWGALVQRGDGAATYEPMVSWATLDERSERELGQTFAEWLRKLIRDSASKGETVLVFHYSHAEPTYLNRILGKDDVADLVDHFVDLLGTIREHFFGVDGLGIKKVAPAFGFNWRDDEPGGLQSQVWLEEARDRTDAAGATQSRARLLAYNEDDVMATAAIRAGLTATAE